jgi:hypothetical protein
MYLYKFPNFAELDYLFEEANELHKVVVFGVESSSGEAPLLYFLIKQNAEEYVLNSYLFHGEEERVRALVKDLLK